MANIAGIIILIVLILIALLVFAGLIVLQVFLSKRESKFAGLVLPILSFVMAIVIAIAVPAFSLYNQAVTVTYSDGDGFYAEDEVIAEEIIIDDGSTSSTGIVGIAVPFIIIFILSNIPTAIYLAIYFGCRPKSSKNQLGKMSVQDLG